MLITKETDYALRILRGLTDGERHTMRSLCQAEAVPQQFAYKILKKLSQAGLVRSVRGVSGGCELAGDLSQTTLYDLMEAMEENRQVIACLQPGYQCKWEKKHGSRCTVHQKLGHIQEMMDQELRSHSLQSLMSGEE